MFKLLRFLKGYRKQAVLAPLFKLFEALLELFVPLVVASIIDKGIGGASREYTVRMCLLLVLFALVGLGFSVLAQYFSAKTAVGFTAKVRHALFAHIQSLSYTELDRMGTATLITRLTSDMNQIQNGVNLTLRLFLRSPFIVFGAMIMAFSIDVKTAMIFVLVIPVLSVVVFGIMLLSIPLYRRVQLCLDRVLSLTRQNLTGVRVLRAFCKETEQTELFAQKNNHLTKEQKRAAGISALMNPLTYVIINIGIIVLIYTGALRVDAGILTQGAVVALYNYMSQILVELVKLANLIINITKSIACGNRVQAVFETESSLKFDEIPKIREVPSLKPGDVCVTFDHATLRYQNASDDMLHDICFTAKAGQTIGVIGGTGSGKSSLVNLIPRFYDVTSGAVRVFGNDVREYPLAVLREAIGMVPQKAVLFSGTIKSNLCFRKAGATDEELWEALRLAQAEEFVRKLPEGLDAPVSQGGKNFSGGQRQRLTIARALVGHPSLLILDDSASALDYATDAALRKALASLPQKPCCFIVSQRTASLMHADTILVMDDGQLVGAGTHEELLANCVVYKEIYDSQFKKEKSTAPSKKTIEPDFDEWETLEEANGEEDGQA